MNLINIITLLQMALSLLSNPNVQSNPAMLAQANTFAQQAIIIAEDSVAQDVATVQASTTLPNEGGTTTVTMPAPTTAITSHAAPTKPADVWTPEGKYMVSNQFAFDSNATAEWLNGPNSYEPQLKVLATTTFQFTISGRLVQLESDPAQQTPEKWFPMPSVPLTITYGNQSRTATTDSNGVAAATFNATGISGDHQFTYSAQGLNITDYGTVTEWPMATSTQ